MPVLAALLKYAEALKMRRKGSNQTTVETISYQLPPGPAGSFQLAAWAGPTVDNATDYDTFNLTIQR